MGLQLDGKRIVVVCGPGGVGKTTISSAVALSLASGGRRTIALTVDPAKRLADALGLRGASTERSTVAVGGGRHLTAMLLDTKRTFDELVDRHAGSPERRDRILANRFYRRLTDTLSGTHEYMAMERLYRLATEEDWDAIVVDTPPSRSALSFLDAPRRMTELLGGRMFRWLLRPYRAAGRVGARGAGLGARALAATVGRIAGGELLSDTADFLGAFEGMYEGFRERAGRVVELLGDDATGFVVVSAPEPASLREAAAFLERVGSAGMSAAAVVVNRCRSAPPVEVPPAALEALERGSGEERAIAACVRATLRINQMQSRQHEAIMELRPAAGPSPILEVPELAPGLRGRRALEAVARSLFG